MPIAINGTTGISGVDGSASAPALQGSDSNTGVSFGTDTVNINTGGTTRATIDSTGALDVPTDFPIKVGGSEKLKIDSSGRLLVGISSSVSAGAALQAFGTTDSQIIFGSTATSATGTATLNMCPSNSITGAQIICTATEDFSVSANRTANLKLNVRHNGTFYTAAEFSSVSAATFASISNSGDHFKITNSTTSNTGTMLFVESNRNSTNGSYKLAQWGSTTAARFQVLDSGTVQNGNGVYQQISDETLKENIVDADSQWNDIKNIKIRKFNFKESVDPEKTTMIGVIAQEVELVSPNLVSSDISMQGGEEKEYKSFKQSILYMKAVKCLQEAIAKIEVLETKVAALEAA